MDAMINLNLSDDMLRTIVAGAIWEMIPEAEREKMVTGALKQLMMTEDRGGLDGDAIYTASNR